VQPYSSTSAVVAHIGDVYHLPGLLPPPTTTHGRQWPHIATNKETCIVTPSATVLHRVCVCVHLGSRQRLQRA
jgi:hypothetical protein